MRLLDVDTKRLSGLKYKLVCRGRGGIREFVDYADGPVFPERELMGLGVYGYL